MMRLSSPKKRKSEPVTEETLLEMSNTDILEEI